MTDKEMTALFTVMLLAWPNAETFKGGIPKLKPTIKLWAAYANNIDFWTGQQAVIRLCKHSKFPPTIAKFLEEVDRINEDIKRLSGRAFQEICNADIMYGSLAAFYSKLPPGSFTRAVIDAMGGISALSRTWIDDRGKERSIWNLQEMENACQAVMRGRPEMVGGMLPELNNENGR